MQLHILQFLCGNEPNRRDAYAGNLIYFLWHHLSGLNFSLLAFFLLVYFLKIFMIMYEKIILKDSIRYMLYILFHLYMLKS